MSEVIAINIIAVCTVKMLSEINLRSTKIYIVLHYTWNNNCFKILYNILITLKQLPFF
jgi:hypothetical protein